MDYETTKSVYLWRGYASPPAEITIQIFLWILAALTVLGNILVLIVFVRDGHLRARISNLFILNLALADLLVGCISIPFYNLYRETGLWRYGEGICKFWMVMDFSECYISVYAIVLISYDRYVLITKGMEYDKVQTFRKFVAFSSLTWAANIVRYFVAFVMYDIFVETDVDYSNYCDSSVLYKSTFIIYDMITSNLIPVALIIFFNTKVYMDIKRRSRGMRRSQVAPEMSTATESVNQDDSGHSNISSNRRQGTTDIRKHRRAAVTLALIVGVSTICWIPYFTVIFLSVSFGVYTSARVQIIAAYIFYSNSAIDPLLYVATNPRIRGGIAKLFGLRKRSP
ncbi:histamine H4 receptor-like [Amphiura filiformis]|uniref:histamine H4 receptor-like n=1 Tax=Amphiura filiformis TaxID=82378 RepID=UPI003B211ED9